MTMASAPLIESPDGSTLDLAAAYVALQQLLLDSVELVGFLHGLAVLATTSVPTASCGITMLRAGDTVPVASSDDHTAALDGIQHGVGSGPCLEALRSGVTVRVDDVTEDARWDGYREHAIAYGMASSLSIPLIAQDETLGALNLYDPAIRRFTPSVSLRAEAFARQSAITIAIALRTFDHSAVEKQLREALAARAVIDQASGILMGQRRIGSRAAFAVLREVSQTRNRPLRVVAADLVQSVTGHPPDPPRPFIEPR